MFILVFISKSSVFLQSQIPHFTLEQPVVTFFVRFRVVEFLQIPYF
jgi:hypothetical protein